MRSVATYPTLYSRRDVIKTALVVLLLLAGVHAPWRVGLLGVETLLMSPGPVRSDDGNNRFWDALSLEGRLEGMNYAVAYVSGLEVNGSPAYGLTNFTDHLVVIESRLHWNARLAVLAHEAGHTLQPGWVSVHQGEAFAETVAMLISHDGYREHARYLAGHKMDALFMMVVEWRAMYNAAAVLEDR